MSFFRFNFMAIFAFLPIFSAYAADVTLSDRPVERDTSEESRCGDQLRKNSSNKLSGDCGKPVPDKVDPNLICTVDRVDIGKTYNTSYIVDDTLEQRIHIGAMFWADSITDGTYKPIRMARKPLRISTNLPFVDGTPKTEIEEPELDNIREAISALLVQQERGRLQAKLAYSSTKAKSVQHVDFSVDGGFSRSGFSLSGKLGLSEDSDSNLIVGRFIQEYYTIDINPGTDARDLLENEEDIRAIRTDPRLPVYVSSIKYGRLMLFVLETKEDKRVVDAALNFKLGDDEEDGAAKEASDDTAAEEASDDTAAEEASDDTAADPNKAKKKKTKAYLDLKSNFDKLMKHSKLSAIVIGGNNSVSAGAIRSFEDFETAIIDGAEFDDQSLGRPISYTLSSLKDGSVIQVNMATKYNKRTCVQGSTKYEVTLKDLICVKRSKAEGWDDGFNATQEVSGGLYAYITTGKDYLPHTKSFLVDLDSKTRHALMAGGKALLNIAPVAAAEQLGGGSKTIGSEKIPVDLTCADQLSPPLSAGIVNDVRESNSELSRGVFETNLIFDIPRDQQSAAEFVIGGSFTEYDGGSANDPFNGHTTVPLRRISDGEMSFDLANGGDLLRAYFTIKPVN